MPSSSPGPRTVNRPYLVIGVLLLVVAGITAWDASSMQIRANYGVGADAASYLVAAFLTILALGHFAGAVRGAELSLDRVDYAALGWVGLALLCLVGVIGLGGGFIPAMTLLFAFTARAFGRRALLADIVIGAVLALLVYLLFHGLLTLTLPVGPIERLI
jgi:putative tricarboxylic transport membrane protein